MSKRIAIYSELNDADYDKAKKLAQEGFDMWNDPKTYPQYHDVGYAEVSEELLKKAGIKYDIFDVDHNVDY